MIIEIPKNVDVIEIVGLKEWIKEHDKQIRADAIEDGIHHLDNSKVNCHEDYVDGIDFAIGVLENIAEQLKSQDSME